MRPASGKKFVFAEREQQSYDLTPEKKPQQKRQSEAHRNDRHAQPQQPTTNTRLNDKGTGVAQPPLIPKHRKPVDVLKYANEIVEKARKVDSEVALKDLRPPSPKHETAQSKKSIGQAVQAPPSKQPAKQLPEELEASSNRPHEPRPRNNFAENSQPSSGTTQNNPKQSENPRIIKQYQLREKELLSKVDFLEEEVHSATKEFQQLQAKYNTLAKEHKNCSKEIKRLADALKEKQAAVTKLLQNDDVPYDRKRECILQNQLKSLRDYNRELVLRLKAYKGSELAELAVQYNKVSILNDYVKERSDDDPNGKLELQSLAFQLSKDLDSYALARAKKRMNFAEEQRQLVCLQKNINAFCMACLVDGLKVPSEEVASPAVSMTQAVRRQCQSTKLIPDFEIALRNTQFNIKVCSELDLVMGDQQQLCSYLQKDNVKKVLEECFNVKGKRPSDISRMVEERVLVYVNRNARLNYVLLAALTSTLARYDVLSCYLTETVGKMQTELKRVARPLEDLFSLYEHGGQRNDEAYREKLARFVRSNIEELRLQISATTERLGSAVVDFTKLKNLV